MTNPIDAPDYWRQRLAEAEAAGQLHHAVFCCREPQWRAIEARHRAILARHVVATESVLDAGCGYGRLLDLLPKEWAGDYLGLDLSPDFVELAQRRYPGRRFVAADLRDLRFLSGREMWDWCVLVSVRGMVLREMGADAWRRMEAELRRVSRRLLVLEYGADDEGEVL